MNKSKTIFQCSSCGYISSKWTGKCIECGEWNTITEKISKPIPKNDSFNLEIPTPKLLNNISSKRMKELKSLTTSLTEF
jgi:DNA repair protein RadA/Sms